MQRSSGSIGSLAAALAKAQRELINPEKSLVATIRADARRGAEQTFRYAPLSSGLEIVRKTLGQHEIATVQTTSLDQAAGIINLTTVLAHASGEWIASDWPVCQISETATPHRMGAALTYARRYALFTLVGIAGEDDLDAPDLSAPTDQTSQPTKPDGGRKSPLNGGRQHAAQRATHLKAAIPTLSSEASAELRDRLVVELNELGSGDDAAIWAHRSLAEKNKLTAADAQRLEETFQARLAALAPAADMPAARAMASVTSHAQKPRKTMQKNRSPAEAINKSVLALPEPRRVRDRDHVKSVARHPCLICGRRPADAHHLRFAQSKALSRKVSDEFTVPLCRGHHREVHRSGDEAGWWRTTGIDPTIAARSLWRESHPLSADLTRTGIESAAAAAFAERNQSLSQRQSKDNQSQFSRLHPK